jgi:alpha-1,2-mannosyltransferase
VRFLNRERLTVYPRIILVGYILCSVGLVLSAAYSKTGLTDFLDRPLGADFSHYWIASSLAQAGHPLTVYQAPKFIAALEAFFKVAYPVPWFYPPTFLLIIYPLAFLPYLVSLVLWLTATLTAFLAVLRRIAPHPLTLWLALAFPGTFQNFFHGQNGFLTTALLGGGLGLLNHSPWVAGFLLGLVSYKPHLFALVPVALIAARRWRVLLAALSTAILLALASFLLLGQGVWVAFWKNLALTMTLAREGLLPINKMVTIFAGLLQAGVGFSPALIIQGVVMVLVAAGVFYVWQRKISLARQASILVLGTLLFTPYAFSYDLALLALPLAWLGWEGYNAGWLPGEPGLLCLGWLLPFIAPMMAIIKCPITPLILAALLILVVKSSRAGASPAPKPINP